MIKQNKWLAVVGTITSTQDTPPPKFTVQVYLLAPTGTDRPLGKPDRVDGKGRYAVKIGLDELESAGGDVNGSKLFIRVFDGDAVLGESEPRAIEWPQTEIDLRLDLDCNDTFRVYGTVRDVYGELLEQGTVEAFDRDLRNEQLLGRTGLKRGQYEIRYRRSQFRRAEKDLADLVIKVIGAEDNELHRTPIRYNAPAELELHITLQTRAYEGPSEWEVLTNTLLPLLEEVRPADLREDDQFQDVSFLTGEIGKERLLIATWIACFRLAEKTEREDTPLSPEVFYAFMRQGQPSVFYDTLLEDMQHDDRRTLLEDKILRRLAELAPDLQRSLLQKALADNLVPARLEGQVDQILEMLALLKLRYAAEVPFGGGKGTIGELLELTPAAKQQQTAFLAALTAHAGPLGDFWKKLEEDEVLPAEAVQQVKLSFELGALTRNHIPLVGELVRRVGSGDLPHKRHLATYDRSQWKALFQQPGPDGTPIDVPSSIDGETPDARRETYAAILEQQFERAYPTTSFAAKLARSKQSALAASDDLSRFFAQNPDFQLDRFRIDHYVAEHEDALDGIEDKEKALTDLKVVQRVFKLHPTHQAVEALLERNIDSAQRIYFMGQGQFVAAMAESGLNTIEAKQLYRKAENTYALALALFGDYNRALNGVGPFALPTHTLDAETQARIAALPNLQTLFGSLDYCECTHCRSVYSPAAYFVDVLRFLGERGTQGTGIHAGKRVLDVLLERRPDLGEIELSCENTNTPMPYIDLVNEILADVIAPPTPVVLAASIEADLVAGPIRPSVRAELTSKSLTVAPDAQVYAPDSRGHWVVRDAQRSYKIFHTGTTLSLLPTRQTTLSAAELRANPEHPSPAADDKLRQEVFPLDLPFDLPLLQTRTYLNHLGVQQPRLFELFQQQLADDVTLAPTDLQIGAAWLNLAETERQIIAGTLLDKQPWDYWGLAEDGNDLPNPDFPADPMANITGSWIAVLGHVSVMLHRSGLTYKELLLLLEMKYVNPDGRIFIFDTSEANAASCDTSQFTIHDLDAAALGRIHRFVRLWRKLGCAMWELDLLLPDTSADPAIVDKQLDETVLGEIAFEHRVRERTGLDWRQGHSFYHGIDHAIYLDHTQDGSPAVQTLYQRLFRNKLVGAVASFPPSPEELTGTIADRVPGILAAFRIKEVDLEQILAHLGLSTSSSLDASALGRIHRITALAKALSLEIDAFLRLERLWAKDPFASPTATWRFIQLADEIAAFAFTVAEVDYLLAHRYLPSSGVALEDKTIIRVAQALREGLQKISDDLRRKSEETEKDYIENKLGLLPALKKDADQRLALALVDGSWQGSTAKRNALIDRLFANFLDLAEARTNLAAIPDGLTPAARQAEVDRRCQYVQPALELFLLQTSKEAFIVQKVAEVLQLDTPSASALLTSLRLPSASSPLLAHLDDPRLLARLADGTYEFALGEPHFPSLFRTLRLLHKSALVIGRLGIRAEELSWWLEDGRAAALGWVHPGEFPIDGSAPVELSKWLALRRFFAWKDELPKSDITALELMSGVLDASRDSSACLADLARLTGWDPADLTALVTAFHWLDAPAGLDVVKQELHRSTNLLRLAECFRALRRLGVNAARAIQWARAVPGVAEADDLKQTVKAKYDLPQWQQVIQPLQDDFREAKRQALVSYLVTHPDKAQGQHWIDANGLYSHFLIDVEMGACMLTSRLKQAAASAQLFVQRCLLNLEADIVARTDVDPKWKQWKWMKRYRVWEANRKVFLYPENWIEPQLRDEKSTFFNELEHELLQNDVTAETAEQAYLNYLEKLDKVANLEIRATFHQIISQDESILHVIGRSRSSAAPEHYHRKHINDGRWTAWEKIELDINSNHLVAGVHNRRFFLLWPQFLDKADAPTTTSTPSANSTNAPIAAPTKLWEIRLFWSELKKGKWTPKVLSDSHKQLYASSTGGEKPEHVSFRTRMAPNIQVRLFNSADPSRWAPTSHSLFDKLGKQITVAGASVEHLISPAQSQYWNNLIRHNSTSQYFYYGSIEESGKAHLLPAHENAVAIRLLRAIQPGATYSVIDSQAKAFLGDDQFFFWDARHTYFVDYSWRIDYSYFSRAWHSRVVSSFKFFIHYHPYVELFIKELNIWGIKGLLNRRIQVAPNSIPGRPAPFDFADYQPESSVVQPWPVEDVDFTYRGAYSIYNWELFFHAPFFIASKLAANQRFEEALEWFHYVFDPTSTDTAAADPNTPQQKFWITKPFYETTKADYYQQKVENIMLGIARGDAELREQVKEWRNNPFNPHLIARMRTVAYQKNVLIKYIQTLIAWADQLFRQDTIESLNEATQLYVLAASVLGPRPKSIPKNVANPIKTFYQLQQEGIDDFGNALKQVENLLPGTTSSGTMGDDVPELPRLDVLYFCIPNNEKLLTLWDTVADRLFKVRHCMTIEGTVRQLALFEPPIDPALLVQATAAGLDIGTALADMNAPLPLYRFTFMIQRAQELCNEVRSLGSAMLAALEKRDAEAFALLRASHERTMLDQIRLVKDAQVEEALRHKESLEEARKVIEERKVYYEKLLRDGLSPWEKTSLVLTDGAIVAEFVSTYLNAQGSAMSMIPDLNAGASGFGGSPHVTLTLGGRSVSISLSGAAEVSKSIASIQQIRAGMTATIASHNRRAEEWDYQKRLANKELPQAHKQIAAASIRHQIAIQELANQDKQIENAQSEEEFMRSKFTNQELYDWQVNQLSMLYFQSYQLAYDVAKRAERCFRYELGLTESSYIQFGYWDTLKKGLLCGERLAADLKRLETAYYEQNRREYELSKHVSLALLDPVALIKLRQNGECFVDIPETAFDADYPGHYFRRLKTVALSIPCVTGPYTTISCTLTLNSNRLRKDATLLGDRYERDLTIDDPRFRDEIAAIQSIATSTAQNDDGLFELSFRDERYLPFEGAGAISSWHIKLNKDIPQFDFSTITDVIIHLQYTSRGGGEFLRAKAAEAFNQKMNEQALAENRRGLFRVFDLKREYSERWHRFLRPANPAEDQALVLDDLADRLPFFTQRFPQKRVRQIEVVAQMKDREAEYRVQLSPLGTTPAALLGLSPDGVYEGMHRVLKDLTGSEISLDAWTIKLQTDDATDFRSLPADAVEELFLIINYTVA